MTPVLAACFITCIISATGGIPTFDKGFESVVAEEESFFEVLCSASGARPIYYNWYDQYEQNITSESNSGIHSYATYNGSWLMIPKIRINHQGIYICTANNAKGLSSKLFNISVTPGVSPMFDRKSESLVIEENSYFEVFCLARGVQPIFYNWFDRHDQNITSIRNNDIYSYTTYNGSWLIIPHANASHEGTYNCTASNSKGVSTKVFNISVIPGGSLMFDNDYEYMKAEEASYFEVLCSARGVRPIYYNWSDKYGRNISSDQNNTIFTYETYNGSWLVIPNVNKGHDGLYNCSARNQKGYAKKRYYINVAENGSLLFDNDYENVIVEESSDLEVLCSARGVQPIYYTWSDQYGNISDISYGNNTIYIIETYNGSKLIIPNVNKSLAGFYNCTARNEQGYAKKRYYINVVERGSPMFDDNYVFLKAEESSSFEVLCSANGVRPIYYNWIDKYGRNISSNENNTVYTRETYNGSWLIIPYVYKSHAGDYNCSARNERGVSRKTFYLRVLERGSLMFDNDYEYVKAEEASYFEVLCSARGSRPIYYNWSDKYGRNISSDRNNTIFTHETYNGSWLIIPNVNKGHDGLYNCSAINERGYAKKSYYINVPENGSLLFDNDYENVIVEESSDLEVLCSARGVQPIYYTWSDQHGNISDISYGNNTIYIIETYNGSKLIIPNVNKSHAGFYNCTARNEHGYAKKRYYIIVAERGSLMFDDNYVFVKAEESSYFEVLCSANGVRPIYYNWIDKYGRNISSNENNTVYTRETYNGSWLIIPDVNKSHAGNYNCSARNERGVSRKTFYLRVVERELLTFDTDYEDVMAEEFSYLNVLCSARGVRPIYYNWTDPNYNMISSNELNTVYTYDNYNGSWLIIPKVYKSHEGFYNCSAENKQGYARKSYYINVVENTRNDTNSTEAIVSFRAVTVTNSSVLFDIRTVGKVEGIHVLYYDNFLTWAVFRNYWRVGQPYELRELTAGASYTFQFSLSGDSWTKPYTVVLLPAAPEIIFRGLKEGSVEVEWFQSHDSISRGTIDKHVISYNTVEKIEENSWKPGNCTINIEVPVCNAPRYTITNLSKGFYYEISVRAHTKSGVGSASYNKVYIA